MKQWMENPMGKGSTVLQLRVLRENLDRQYMEIKGKIKVKWFSIGEKYYVAHIKVPSLSVDRLSYDVLLEFDMETLPKNSIVMNECAMRVFSNCPSFTYTYAHVYMEQGNLIQWCKSKYPSKVFSKDPVKRNPQKVLNYERSLYFAIKYITSEGRNYKSKLINGMIKVTNPRSISQLVKSSDEILKLYEYGKSKTKNKEKEKEQEKKKTKKDTNKKKNKGGKGKVQTVKKVATTRSTKKVKKIKKI